MATAVMGRVCAVVAIVLDTLARLGSSISPEPTTAGDVRDRAAKLSLAEAVKYPDAPKHRKHFTKLLSCLI